MKSKVYKFKIFEKYHGLVSGIFPKKFGNFSLKHGNKREVEENKKTISKELGIDWKNIYTVEQFHSSRVLVVNTTKQWKKEPRADGMITDKKNVFLLVKTADCFPVVFFDPKNQVVGIAHVGWRGAIEKIFFNALLKMILAFNSKPAHVLVGIGPGIRKCCFKHKSLVQEKLVEWEKYIKNNGEWKSLDIPGFIKDQLVEAGVKKENIEDMEVCTNCDKRFYSHFRSLQTGEAQGRFASLIGLQ